ncbi:phosphoribosylglycinamide formyltransferase active site [Lucifera butyrica]|uniref:Methionyl-tRNA formyltransferase n=1 Tax=Lucifera butyrica TaxID=1351585 RepID=A0A498RAE5_9FIRM|nr:methionyl-tRNA formyltransferase [Lucifera butyrica]VBB07945.1 phosphoribosylglycinamide formyltransferase active site [Lucifera butyrica]
MGDIRAVFMGTPEFAVPCLDMLLTESYQVVAVVTQPDRPKGRGQKRMPSPVKMFAEHHGLSVLTPEKIKDPAIVSQLAQLQPDIIIVVAYGQFLPLSVLKIPPLGCVNVHASLLPQYRGAAPIHWAVIRGEAVTGITTMFMDAGMDTGDMILKETTPIGPTETTAELHDRLKGLGAQTLSKTLQLLARGNAPRIPQDNGEATYAPLLKKELEKINWCDSARNLHNLVRGLNSWPGAYCLYRGKVLKIWCTGIGKANSLNGRPGRIAGFDSGSVQVETGDGILEITELQPESKKRMTAADFIKGHKLNVNEMFE